MSDTCSTCGASIVRGKTKAGKRMPLDAEPIGGLLTEEGEIVSMRRSHFATCPDAALHSRGKS